MTRHRYPAVYGRKCLWCKKAIEPTKKSNTKYCCAEHRRYASKKRKHDEEHRHRAAQTQAEIAYESGVELGRTGPVYKQCEDAGWFDDIHASSKSQTDVAVLIGVSVAAVNRAYQAWLALQIGEREAAKWVMDERYANMLPVGKVALLRSLTPTDDSCQPLINECLKEFWKFEHEFMTIGSAQVKFIVEPFHEESIEAIFRAFLWGGRTLILTPPRHGKSEMLLRFIAWIIIMYPNIQVLWVAANADLAENMCTKLKGVFSASTALREAFLPPRKKFGDEGAPRWRGHSFTLYTRTDLTLTSPTFTALGSSATVAGRNADFIGIDDLEERKTVETADLRAKSRRKHSEIMERQENHTGVVTIGSRQHLDDIPNHLLNQEGNAAWDVHVFPAHDEIGCTIDPDDEKNHIACMLLPEIRSYQWLSEVQAGTIAMAQPGHFQLRYLQKAVPIEGIIFDIERIKENCLDRSRGLGMDELPAMRLIAGLDPATRGVQASFCWGWDGKVLHMIDLETQKAGGVDGAVWVMRNWYERWDLKDWFHEDNSGQIDTWKQVEDYKDVVRELELNIKPHTTGKNKHDPESGISSMATWYHAGRISLPYGTAEARLKVNELLRQLELWTSDGLNKRGKTDIKMAHWFPFPTIQKWARNETGDVKLELTSNQSYPAIDTMTMPGWGYTRYPGE